LQIYRERKKGTLKNTSLALGVFDGVHVGHQMVIRDAIQKAEMLNLTPAVVTFSKHPRLIISGSAPQIITPMEEKLRIFKELGIENTIILDFTEELAKMPAEQYLKEVLQECFGAKNISVGYNHRFGSDRKSAGDFLKTYCSENNINLSIIPPVKIDHHTVSSSVIRGFISSGDVASAAVFLGKPFKLSGEVIEGQHIGRQLGFPTANLKLDDSLILPLRGVYSGVARVRQGEYKAVISIGRRPTVGEFENDLVEVHILDFSDDIYGETLDVLFLDRLREEKKFSSLDELKEQIKADCLSVMQLK
jgi:riboflavin kinase/FMN adenylyltransferase